MLRVISHIKDRVMDKINQKLDQASLQQLVDVNGKFTQVNNKDENVQNLYSIFLNIAGEDETLDTENERRTWELCIKNYQQIDLTDPNKIKVYGSSTERTGIYNNNSVKAKIATIGYDFLKHISNGERPETFKYDENIGPDITIKDIKSYDTGEYVYSVKAGKNITDSVPVTKSVVIAYQYDTDTYTLTVSAPLRNDFEAYKSDIELNNLQTKGTQYEKKVDENGVEYLSASNVKLSDDGYFNPHVEMRKIATNYLKYVMDNDAQKGDFQYADLPRGINKDGIRFTEYKNPVKEKPALSPQPGDENKTTKAYSHQGVIVTYEYEGKQYSIDVQCTL